MRRRMHFHDLPEELIRYAFLFLPYNGDGFFPSFRSVFLKLPISSVLVARAVCKSWKLFLSSSSFLIEHDATSPRESWIISRQQNGDLTLFKTTTNKQFQLRVPSRSWLLVGASEGLLCFLLRFAGDIKRVLVYNPVTRASREVEHPPPLEWRRFWNFTCSKETGEWKVAILDPEGQLVVRPHVLSSRTGEWRLSSKPVRKDHCCIPWTTGTGNLLPAYDWNGNVVVTYDMDTDSWTELEGRPPLMRGAVDWAILHCKGHGTFITKSVRVAEAERVGVFKHISDKEKWELVSQSPLVADPAGSAFYITDGQDNIWIEFFHGQLLMNYNVASDEWRFFQCWSWGPIIPCTFTFRQP